MSYKIHVYSSGELGIFANAFLVETNKGVVVIDSTLTVSGKQLPQGTAGRHW